MSCPIRRSWTLSLFLLLVLPAVTLQRSLDKRTLTPMSVKGIASLISSPDPIKNVDPSKADSHLSKILIPRASDTKNNTLVREHIVSTLKALKWHVELDEFTDTTPIGSKKFANIIATKDPHAARRVILAAHYDSKYFPHPPMDQFVGATDSAAPCAMMLDVAEALNPLLDEQLGRHAKEDEKEKLADDITLQLVFFDGEEAFVDWTDTDSVYGARNLARKWETTYVSNKEKRRVLDVHATELGSIENLILLDLLGAPNPSLQSYFVDTAWLYDALVSVEKRLGESGAFAYEGSTSMAPGKWRSWFRPRTSNEFSYGSIGDDHVPFLKRGVSILHLIANPFPSVWHRLEDNVSALDVPTMRRWNVILRVFMAEYLNLQPEKLTQSDSSPSVQRSTSELVSML